MKRILLPLLSAALALTLAGTAKAAETGGYIDTAGHWAQHEIETWSDYKVLQGYEDRAFHPDAPITRGELAALLDRVMGFQTAAENVYPDLPPDAWYTPHVLHMAAAGIFTGDGVGMKPEEPILRQEAFAALARVLQVEPLEKAPGFSDDDAISGWAKGYLAALKEAGGIQGSQMGAIRPGEPITRAEVISVLARMAPGFIGADGTYSADCGGALIVNAQNVALKDMTVSGDLIVADGVGNGDVSLENVTVTGTVRLRGCGAHSFHLRSGAEVGTVIITKTAAGRLRLVNESGTAVPMIYVSGGTDGVSLEGELEHVVVRCAAPVNLDTGRVEHLSADAAGARVSVGKDAQISRLDVGAQARGTALEVEGTVTDLVTNTQTAVTNRGRIVRVRAEADGLVLDGVKPDHVSTADGVASPKGSGSGISHSGGGEGTQGESGAGPAAVTISAAQLQLRAPAFGCLPGAAVVRGEGFAASTLWQNEDGSPASLRLDGTSFTSQHRYRAVVTLTPERGYAFAPADALTVRVTDPGGPAGGYPAPRITADGGRRVVTLLFDATEKKPPVEDVTVTGDTLIGAGEVGTLRVSYQDNLLLSGFTYQWYTAADQTGAGAAEIPRATGVTYEIGPEGPGTEFYLCVVTAGEETFPSGVIQVERPGPPGPADIPTPVFSALEDELSILGGIVQIRFALEQGQLSDRADLDYVFAVDLRDSAGQPLGQKSAFTVPADLLYKNPTVCFRFPFLPALDPALSGGGPKRVEIGRGEITVTPSLRAAPDELPGAAHTVQTGRCAVSVVVALPPDYDGGDAAFLAESRPEGVSCILDLEESNIRLEGAGIEESFLTATDDLGNVHRLYLEQGSIGPEDLDPSGCSVSGGGGTTAVTSHLIADTASDNQHDAGFWKRVFKGKELLTQVRVYSVKYNSDVNYAQYYYIGSGAPVDVNCDPGADD